MLQKTNVSIPTLSGDANQPHRARYEQERLEKNKERRKKREKQKKLQQKLKDGGAGDEGSPEPSTEKAVGTTRKCANCGQVGHIKTNKKYVCPCSRETAEPPEAEEPKKPGRGRARGPGKRLGVWRPTTEPREGDKFWDPRCWGPGALENQMGPALTPKGKQTQITGEDPEHSANDDE